LQEGLVLQSKSLSAGNVCEPRHAVPSLVLSHDHGNLRQLAPRGSIQGTVGTEPETQGNSTVFLTVYFVQYLRWAGLVSLWISAIRSRLRAPIRPCSTAVLGRAISPTLSPAFSVRRLGRRMALSASESVIRLIMDARSIGQAVPRQALRIPQDDHACAETRRDRPSRWRSERNADAPATEPAESRWTCKIPVYRTIASQVDEIARRE
jgi:hypothetical protein